jgi:hypothetical protein
MQTRWIGQVTCVDTIPGGPRPFSSAQLNVFGISFRRLAKAAFNKLSMRVGSRSGMYKYSTPFHELVD